MTLQLNEKMELLTIATEELERADREIRDALDPDMSKEEQDIIRRRILTDATDAIRQRAIDKGYVEDDLLHVIH